MENPYEILWNNPNAGLQPRMNGARSALSLRAAYNAEPPAPAADADPGAANSDSYTTEPGCVTAGSISDLLFSAAPTPNPQQNLGARMGQLGVPVANAPRFSAYA